MKTTRARYQNGSITKQPCPGGFVWKVRFSESVNEKRHLRAQTFDCAKCPTEMDVGRAIGRTAALVNARTNRAKREGLIGTVMEISRAEHLPELEPRPSRRLLTF